MSEYAINIVVLQFNNKLSIIRAIGGSIIVAYMMRMEGWPIQIIVQVLPMEYRYSAMFILLGIVAGIIAGSSFWGTLSILGAYPVLFIFILGRGGFSLGIDN